MKALSRISFPVIVTAIAVAGSLNLSRGPVESSFTVAPAQAQDTVVYPTTDGNCAAPFPSRRSR